MAFFGRQDHHSGGHKPRRATAAMATFYFAKSRQDLGLGSLASRGGPEYAHDNACEISI